MCMTWQYLSWYCLCYTVGDGVGGMAVSKGKSRGGKAIKKPKKVSRKNKINDKNCDSLGCLGND